MNKAEYDAHAKQLQREVAEARSRAKAASLLQDKLVHLTEARAIEEKIRQHKLNIFELVTA